MPLESKQSSAAGYETRLAATSNTNGANVRNDVSMETSFRPKPDAGACTAMRIGVSLLGSDGNDVTELLAAADAALYRAKSTGRNRTCRAAHLG